MLRELCRAMLEMEAAQAAADLAAADLRLLELRQQERDIEADLAKLQTEGPANHRKRDHLDKVCGCCPTPIPHVLRGCRCGGRREEASAPAQLAWCSSSLSTAAQAACCVCSAWHAHDAVVCDPEFATVLCCMAASSDVMTPWFGVNMLSLSHHPSHTCHAGHQRGRASGEGR